MDKPVANMVLAPCPFCGAAGDDLMVFCDPVEGADNSGASRRIQCAGCNIEASFYDSKAEAIAAWNRRTQPSLEGEAGEAVKTLRSDAAQLLRMSETAAFGQDLSVRVSDPSLLILSMTTAAALLQSLSADNARLRQIVSDGAAALPNGAFISPETTVEFMAKLPDEIRAVCARLDTQGGGNG